MELFQVSLMNPAVTRWRVEKTMIVIAPSAKEAKIAASNHNLHGGDVWLKDDVQCVSFDLTTTSIIMSERSVSVDDQLNTRASMNLP